MNIKIFQKPDETTFILNVEASVAGFDMSRKDRNLIYKEKFPNIKDTDEFLKVKEIIQYLSYFKEESTVRKCRQPVEYWKYLCVDLLRYARLSLPKGTRLGGSQGKQLKRVEPLMNPLPSNYQCYGVDKFELGYRFKRFNYYK